MKHCRLLLVPVLCGALFLAGGVAGRAVARPEPSSEKALEPLREIGKTGGRLSSEGLTSRVVVKFREGIAFPDLVAAPETAAFAKPDSLVAHVAREAVPGGVRPTFSRPAELLRAEEARLEAETGVDLADLSRYFDVETPGPAHAEALARRLETFDEVEFAYVQAEFVPATVGAQEQEEPPGDEEATPDFTWLQHYLQRAPGGLGIEPLRDAPGGRGEGVRIVDIQYTWNLEHEDLPFTEGRQPFLNIQGEDPIRDNGNHGTAVLGILVGVENEFGVTGICPAAEVGIVNPLPRSNDFRLAQSIDETAALLTRDGARGDIIQIELQARGVNNEIALLPPEWDPAVFDAVQRAVARGVVVVEPAGNGGINKKGKGKGVSLDRPELGNAFNRRKRDSGAIIVGGGFPIDATRTRSSNYGSRLDVQGYGAFVTTLGYGDLYKGGSLRAAYTGGFDGTSSAVPCVTGVAALVQSSLRAAGLPVLDSHLMRALLAGTGTPDGTLPEQRIGPRPNAALAVAVASDPATPFVNAVKYSKKKDRLTIDGIYFAGATAPEEGRAIVYIDDVPVATDYPSGYDWIDGSTTRITATGVSSLLPPKTIVYISVQNGDGTRSPRRLFIRR